mgnify:CR=1 FL=1
MSNLEDRSKLPEWLQDTQNRSWEPEIIISGLTLTSLFILPTKLYEFCGMLIQDYGVDYLSAILTLMYLSFAINLFKIFFIVHLMMRLAWTGMVGLSYAFPKGVINERLFKVFSHHKFKKPAELVMQLERLCSTLFAFPVYVGIILILFTFFLLLLVSISTYFEASIIYTMALLVLSAFIYSGAALIFKNSSFARWIATSIPSTISSVYQSNLGKWPVQISVFVFMIASGPFIIEDTRGFSKFYNFSGIDTQWISKSELYFDLQESEKRFSRAFINTATFKNQDVIELNIAYYAEDERIVREYQQATGSNIGLDSLNWQDVNEFEDLIKVYVNDSLIQIEKWQYLSLPQTNQKVLSTYIDISRLPVGQNNIRIEKLTFADLEPIISRWIIRKKWAEIPFYKTAN